MVTASPLDESRDEGPYGNSIEFCGGVVNHCPDRGAVEPAIDP